MSATAAISLAIMIPPWGKAAHRRWKDWEARFPASNVTVRRVVGAGHEPPFASLEVDAREGLPHVGKVTEKSAEWWRLPGEEEWRCKSDDDTFVHLERLETTLRAMDPERPTVFGHLKWRGWEFDEFRACGGVWGTAKTTWLAFEDGRCPKASGPYPYVAGAFYCLSRAARRVLARDPEFNAFVREAKRRNLAGVPCKTAAECHDAPSATRMWHHEDAGISANLFRAIVRANATLDYVATPGHYNDPFAVEMGGDPQSIQWSSYALWVHGVKRRDLHRRMTSHWKIRRPFRLPTRRCALPEVDSRSEWTRARLSCPDAPERFCGIEPARHFRICRWPWASR